MYDIYFDLTHMHQIVDSDSDSDNEGEGYWSLGENFEFVKDLPKNKSSNGCTCKKCGEIFPYAEPNQKDGTFKCYSCKMWG